MSQVDVSKIKVKTLLNIPVAMMQLEIIYFPLDIVLRG